MGFWSSFLDEYGETLLRSIAYNKGFRDGRDGRGRNMLYYSEHKQPFQREAYDLGYEEGREERSLRFRAKR